MNHYVIIFVGTGLFNRRQGHTLDMKSWFKVKLKNACAGFFFILILLHDRNLDTVEPIVVGVVSGWIDFLAMPSEVGARPNFCSMTKCTKRAARTVRHVVTSAHVALFCTHCKHSYHFSDLKRHCYNSTYEFCVLKLTT